MPAKTKPLSGRLKNPLFIMYFYFCEFNVDPNDFVVFCVYCVIIICHENLLDPLEIIRPDHELLYLFSPRSGYYRLL